MRIYLFMMHSTTRKNMYQKVGWGHSTYTQAIENGKKSSAKKILLTHHHPTRTDEQIDKVAQKLSSNPQYAALDFEFAKEDTEYDAKLGKLSELLDDASPERTGFFHP